MNNTAEKKEEAPQPYANELVKLDRVEAALKELRAKYGTVPDFTTKVGYEKGKKGVRELTSYRTSTDKLRLAITEPHRKFIERVNNYGKELIGKIEAIEKPLKDAKKEVDEAEQRKKEERIARLRERLEKEVTSFLDTAQGLDSTDLAELYDDAQGIDTDGYFDITKEAEDAKGNVIRQLSDMHAAALERERLAAEQAEIDAQRRKLREEEERRAAEQAELEELRRFKAEQDANKARAEQEAEPIDTDYIQDDPDGWNEIGNAMQSVPTEDLADTGELIAAHREAATHWDQALEDLIETGIDRSAAEAVLTAIANGDVRHIAFNA
nr:hypothetical protein [uncultured Halomonas sp.]